MKSAKKDLKYLLGILMEWHDNPSCLCSIPEAIKIGNRHGIKLDLSALDLRTPNDYDLTDEDMKAIEVNQLIK